jgi:hypothetical protein
LIGRYLGAICNGVRHEAAGFQIPRFYFARDCKSRAIKRTVLHVLRDEKHVPKHTSYQRFPTNTKRKEAESRPKSTSFEAIGPDEQLPILNSRIQISLAGKTGALFAFCLLFLHTVALEELLHATFGIHNRLLTREEWVAGRADFHANLFFGRTSLERVAARTGDLTFDILRMNSLFHRFTFST